MTSLYPPLISSPTISSKEGASCQDIQEVLLDSLTSDAVLEAAYAWLCVQRLEVLIDKKRGIARSSSLSPLLGAVYLMPVAKAMDKLKVTCTIFMDDVCLQVPTRWKLRKAIKRLNEVFDTLKIKKHPDKTEIGHVEKGFNFLSYRFLLSGLSVAQIALDRFSAKVTQLDEQRADSPARERYWRQFTYWIFSGLKSLLSSASWRYAAEKGIDPLIWKLLRILPSAAFTSAPVFDSLLPV